MLVEDGKLIKEKESVHPQLSVIIPVYKVEKYLRQCLDSVVNQTFRDLEIIIIDDGSPDDCGTICDEYAQKDNRIIVIHKENGGLSAARNDGIERAQGEWLAFVDSDDWCDADYYETMFKELNGRKADVFVACRHYKEFTDHQIIKITYPGEFDYLKPEEMDFLCAKVLVPYYKDEKNKDAASMGLPWDKLYRTSFIKEKELRFDINSKTGEDVLFNFCVFKRTDRVIGGSCIGYHYRVVSTSITKIYNPNRPQLDYYFLEQLYKEMDRQRDSNLILKAIKTKSIMLVLRTVRECYFSNQNEASYWEKAQAIKELKALPYYKDVIETKEDLFFKRRHKVARYLLRMKPIWPLRIAVFLREKVLKDR